MKKHKKAVIITAVALVLVIGAVIGVIAARKNSRRAFVQSVGDMNMGMYGSQMTYSGRVYESAQQKIFTGSDKVVSEVYVKTGDSVKKGDKLFSYDTTLLELSVEEKQLSVTICENAVSNEQAKLEKVKAIVPYVEPEPEPETEAAEQPTENPSQPASEAPAEEPEDTEQPTEKEEEHYTAQEKADMITSQELAVKRAQTALSAANQALTEAKNAFENATVVSQLDGTVSEIKSISEQNGANAFCTILGNSGVTVKGYVGEYDLKTLSVGDTLSVSSWMSGGYTQAEVLSINDYPTDAQVFGSSGNPTTSYYEFTAFMDDAEGFDIGEDVQITKEAPADGNRIVIDKIYVRSDAGGAYVMKDDGGVLRRQSVKAEKLSDDSVLILEGLTKDDKIAFPYGSLSQEGLLTTTEQNTSLF